MDSIKAYESSVQGEVVIDNSRLFFYNLLVLLPFLFYGVILMGSKPFSSFALISVYIVLTGLALSGYRKKIIINSEGIRDIRYKETFIGWDEKPEVFSHFQIGGEFSYIGWAIRSGNKVIKVNTIPGRKSEILNAIYLYTNNHEIGSYLKSGYRYPIAKNLYFICQFLVPILFPFLGYIFINYYLNQYAIHNIGCGQSDCILMDRYIQGTWVWQAPTYIALYLAGLFIASFFIKKYNQSVATGEQDTELNIEKSNDMQNSHNKTLAKLAGGVIIVISILVAFMYFAYISVP